MMFRLLLTIGTLMCLSGAYSQDTVNQVDREGRKQGTWRKSDQEGFLIYEGQFRDDLPYGKFTYYYQNGKTQTVSEISENGRVARITSWFPNGKLMARGKYLNQQRDSLWQFYSEFDGVLVSEEFYVKGKKHGPEKIFYPGKGVAEIIPWQEGVKEGNWEQFYDDGAPKLQGSYVNDEKEGPFKTFFVNGKLLATGQYRNGHQDGTWTYYDETGKVTMKEYYDDGILVRKEEHPE